MTPAHGARLASSSDERTLSARRRCRGRPGAASVASPAMTRSCEFGRHQFVSKRAPSSVSPSHSLVRAFTRPAHSAAGPGPRTGPTAHPDGPIAHRIGAARAPWGGRASRISDCAYQFPSSPGWPRCWSGRWRADRSRETTDRYAHGNRGVTLRSMTAATVVWGSVPWLP
jgi:hypothetical protein